MKKNKSKIPVILLHETTLSSLGIFNPNSWEAESKQIIQSCSTQYSLLNYSFKKIDKLLNEAELVCKPAISNLISQWNTAQWPLKKCHYFVEIPELHLDITAFLATCKTYLDLIVQLISSEKITNNKIHGFHKDKKIIGGQVLNILTSNAVTSKKNCADKVIQLISLHKEKWIDELVKARDLLTHPEKGMYQVMFELKMIRNGEKLELLKIKKPKVSEMNFNKYAKKILETIKEFSKDFLQLLK